jgi:DNA-binding transcriptional ArsR family regulator
MTNAEPPVHLRDPALMRALAHPARLAIMGYLGTGAAATATECAEIVDLSPSATSYHLRALAKVGLVQEAPSRGDGRERVWIAALDRYQVASDQTTDPDVRAAEDQLVEAFLLLHEDRVRTFMAHREQEPPEWYRVATFSESTLELTADELAALNDKILELVEPYRSGQRRRPPDGARMVSLVYRAFPLPKRDVKR